MQFPLKFDFGSKIYPASLSVRVESKAQHMIQLVIRVLLKRTVL